MIVNRRTFVVKRGCMDAIVALSIAQREQIGRPYRIYVPEMGPFDALAFEFEFENLQEYERVWAEWFGAPDAAEFMAKWYDLTEPGGTNEIWTLAE